MYGKIFEQMYDSTLVSDGKWERLVTFQQLIVLANKHGEVDMTLESIHRRTTIPLDILQRGIHELLKPDPQSRSTAEDGRRIMPLVPGRAWGWRLVNHAHYAAIRSQEDRREYHKLYGRERRAKEAVNKLSTKSTESTDVAVAVDLDVKQKLSPAADAASACPHEAIIAAYHECLPELPAVRLWTPKRQALLRQRWKEDPKRQTLAWWQKFFKHVAASDFLTGRAPGKGRAWQASLEWLLNQTNFVKVIEGNYDNGDEA